LPSFFAGFLEYLQSRLDTLEDGETIEDRATWLRDVLKYFHSAAVIDERLTLLYQHIEEAFPAIENSGALLPMPAAVRLCHTMLSTGLSSPGAVTVLLRSALREPLMHLKDDATELRQLKMIEMLLRVDYLKTQEQLPPEVAEYLSIIRSLRYYDRAIRRDTQLSYQLAFFLRKHGFPSKRHMLGPYALRVCDPQERINFEPIEHCPPRKLVESPATRKQRHLEAVGWRSFDVHASKWKELGTYEAKAAHVRSLLLENQLIDLRA